MNKKKVFSVTIVLVFLIFITIIIFRKPKELEKILTNNEYELKSKFDAGSEVEGNTINRNTYKYKRGNVYLMVFEYKTFEEISNGIIKYYDVYKSNDAFDVLLEKEKNYIYMRACDLSVCNYYLGYDLMLVSTKPDIESREEVDLIFEEIIKERKLK